MNLSRRELLKLGGAALVAPLARYIPDLELSEHPLLSPAHKDIPTHGGMHDFQEDVLGICCVPPWEGDLSLVMVWNKHEAYVTDDLGDTWELIASLDSHMSELQRNLVLRGLAHKIAAENDLRVNYALEMGS